MQASVTVDTNKKQFENKLQIAKSLFLSFYIKSLFSSPQTLPRWFAKLKWSFRHKMNLPDNSLETINLLEIIFGFSSIIEFKSQARQFSWITKKRRFFYLKLLHCLQARGIKKIFLTSSQISIKLKRWRRFGNNRFLMIRGKTI